MGDVVKLLLLLCLAIAVSGKVFRSPETTPECIEGQYKFKNACFLCTGCGEFMYIKAKCSETENTICGWCGRKPDMDTISDEVLASYQTKCLMANLDFVEMARVKEHLGFSDEMQPGFSLRDSIIHGELLEEIDSSEADDNYEAAKDILDNIDDSAEQELPDPTFKETSDYSSSEENTIEEVEDKSGEELPDDYADSELTPDESFDDKITDKVKEHLKLAKIAKDLEPSSSERIPLDDVEEGWIENPRLPVFTRTRYTSYESAEDVPNDRSIRWRPGWMIDDKIKPIGPQTQIVQAEELTVEQYEIVEKKNKKKLTLEEKQDIVNRLTEEIENDPRSVYVSRPPPPPAFLSPIAFAALGLLIVATVVTAAVLQIRGNNYESFTGVPADSPDYQLIVDSSKRLEEQLAKNEKNANRHVHVNPTFDV